MSQQTKTDFIKPLFHNIFEESILKQILQTLTYRYSQQPQRMDKLQALRLQKQQVRKKILQLQGQKVTQNNLTQQAIKALYQKKSMLQHQRAQQQKHRQMQQQYNARKAQLQRQKQLQRIRNQKRMIQLQVGMKRIVLTGVQQKVKGINSDQLLTRAMLNAQELGNLKGEELSQKSRPEVRREFEKYLQKEEVRKEKPKYDLYELNQKRHSLFQRREEMLMREVLLKEMVEGLGSEEHESILEGIDLMKCSREELQRLLEEMGIDIQDYKHPLDSKGIVENYPKIEEGIKANLQLKRRQLKHQELMKEKNLHEMRSLKEWVTQHPNKLSISLMKQLLNDILTQTIQQYQKRHFSLSTQQKQQKLSQLYQNYNQTLEQNQSYELAQHIVQSLERHIRKEILLETAKQIHQLHTFVHDITEMSFDWMFTKKDFLEYQRTEQERLKSISLSFKDESQNLAYGKALKQPGNENNDKSKNSEGNVFETEKSTSELVNDIKLLTTEEMFFEQVLIEVKREIVEAVEDGDFKVHWEGGLFVVGGKGVRQVSEDKDVARDVVGFQGEIRNVKNVKKLNNFWIIQASDAVHIYSNWNTQVLPLAIGERINSPCGLISAIQIYPSFSLLGSLSTMLITFQKGQILKYNFNRNRLTSQQKNTTHYTSFPPGIKTGSEPSFPLNNRNVIQYTSEPAKQSETIHEFREFFDYHMVEVVFVGFYKENMFVTVDKGMNCAVWMYDQRRGPKAYEPYYTFKIRSEYKTFKQSQNPRFKDLYPSSSIPQSPEQMYKKWMQNQAYLKLQIYNNPKKLSAYFKAPKWQQDKSQQPVWKLTYDQKSKRILKIFQTYYNLADGKSQCKQIKLWRQYLVILVERQHVMRHDLKTVKIFTFSLEDKKLRTVAIEFDTFQEQKLLSFDIVEHKMDVNEFPLIVTVSSGKVLVFSMLSGQLLKDISQEQTCAKIRNYNFLSVTKGFGDNFYGSTRGNIVEFVIKNKNNRQKRDQFGRMVEITRKKYNNLV